jgi:hypothetical protein
MKEPSNDAALNTLCDPGGSFFSRPWFRRFVLLMFGGFGVVCHFLKREQERDLAAFLSSSAILLGLTAENAAANMHALQIGGLAGGRSASFWLGRTSCICFVPSKAKPTLTRVMSH